MDTLELTYEVNFGSPGTDRDPENPPSRALRKLLSEGKPMEAFAFCFYSSEAAPDAAATRLSWFGALVASTGRRVIFFPGLNAPVTWIQTTRHGSTGVKQAFLVDHISLELPLKRWHFTSPGSREHKPGGKAVDLGHGRLLWFGISVAEEQFLRGLRAQTVVQAIAPPTDSQRRMRTLLKRGKQAIQHVLSLPVGEKARHSPGFVSFRVITCNPGSKEYRGPPFPIPAGSPSLAQPFPQYLTDVPVRIHQIPLGPSVSVQIDTLWLPGSLTSPLVWTFF